MQQEGFPRPQQWNQLLAERVPSGELMDLDNINMGFIRPRSPLDWQMAYCQSQLYIEHLQKKYGKQTPGELLALTAGHTGEPLAQLRALLEAGPVSVIDLQWLGRLARALPVSALIERGVVGSTPGAALRLAPDAWQRLTPDLALG